MKDYKYTSQHLSKKIHDKAKGNNFKHGMEDTRTYRSWVGMKTRCFNKNATRYKNWGGRGIIVCDEWLNFQNFYRDMGICPDNKSLDRINVNGNYCKENCRWATMKEQQNNRINNRILTLKGVSKTLTQWSEYLKIHRNSIQSRLSRGWSVEKTLTAPIKKIRH